ncbi:MAG TPA: hypothetical protein VFT52_01930 [Luteimonas sp.]|nr:hypothetical protein [Luteimonas sp.]
MPAPTSLTPRRILLILLLAAACGWLAFAPASPLPDDLRGFVAGILAGIGIGVVLMVLVRTVPPFRHWAEACDGSVPALRRRYLREFLPAMGGYVLALGASLWLLKQVEEPVLRAMLALLPVPPVALAVRAIIRYIRDSDELQRRIELEAVSVATALVSMLYFAGGLLQMAKVIDIPSGQAMFWVFPLVCMTYGLAKAFVAGRYR